MAENNNINNTNKIEFLPNIMLICVYNSTEKSKNALLYVNERIAKHFRSDSTNNGYINKTFQKEKLVVRAGFC